MPTKIPYFNAPIYLSNKTQIGKVDEILGPINEVYFTVKMEQGMMATSFKKEDKVYIGGDKLLPIERFLPKPKVAGGKGGVIYENLVSADTSIASSLPGVRSYFFSFRTLHSHFRIFSRLPPPPDHPSPVESEQTIQHCILFLEN